MLYTTSFITGSRPVAWKRLTSERIVE